ncbi:NAD(P)/FAD-dependent oxidoreductase [Deinococcus sp. KSM4-11]|uniref:flavin-containing monooxygenase n=1 Tax=Deinococcus sp. KSM4-11 TaxID=2568654 RepID=UPI0010A39C66|nr:NAD(P)/FAD-dependent oxidoreductase [Deinococcus sp. KSM4-11]THF83950.1 NAD(P)/FAD-dependent oxidoreductase [Deinococcus sp. KSM4-11]
MTTPRAVIVGAGPAGLAVAALLGQAGVPYTLLDARGPASAWRGHYERLHLHTPRGSSGLPGFPMPRTYPRYPSREQVIAYLDGYARHFGIEAVRAQVTDARRDGSTWTVTTMDGPFTAPNLIVATGYTAAPVRPTWPGLDTFTGPVVHSSDYRSGRAYAGQRVLVVGLGNSGGEIALDLHEQGARPTVSVRGPVNVLPRDILGIPTLALGILQAGWPSALADAVNAPIIRALIGDLRPYGLRRPAEGAITQIRRHRRVPVLDVGTVRLVKSGELAVRPGIDHFTPGSVVFIDGREEAFEAVILATGFRPNLAWLHTSVPVLDDHGVPMTSGRPTHEPGLTFCGFHVASSGMLREIAREARRIAAYLQA